MAASWHPTLMPLRPMRPSAWLSQPPIVALRLPVCSLQSAVCSRSRLQLARTFQQVECSQAVVPHAATPPVSIIWAGRYQRWAGRTSPAQQSSQLSPSCPPPAPTPGPASTGISACRAPTHPGPRSCTCPGPLSLIAARVPVLSHPAFVFSLPVASPKPRCDSTNHLIEACCSRSPPDLHLSLPELASCQSPTLLLSYSPYLLSISILIPSLQVIHPRCSVVRASLYSPTSDEFANDSDTVRPAWLVASIANLRLGPPDRDTTSTTSMGTL